MKKIFTLIFAFTTLVTFLTSCSNDDEGGNSSSSEIIGTWGTEWNNGTGNAVHPKFTFMSNGKVKYYVYPSGNIELEEIGTWNMSNGIITMVFPETVEIKFKNKVIFVSETQFNFEEIQESGYDTWNAESYFKTDDPNLN
ncbi:hypothetical protein [Epilithonimonas tenax]|uniref:hypothetical protein n=1 Tax=Epilithonimonas tenax TaxID=191577 RepID=UPI0003F511FC|nr:hypothetical protein [Epilithonimonas tenax]